MTPTEQKQLIDTLARELYGWPDDGTRRTYAPEELPAMARRLRAKAQALADVRTLDDWATRGLHYYTVDRLPATGYWICGLHDCNAEIEPESPDVTFQGRGDTPDAAAEWVRGQARITSSYREGSPAGYESSKARTYDYRDAPGVDTALCDLDPRVVDEPTSRREADREHETRSAPELGARGVVKQS